MLQAQYRPFLLILTSPYFIPVCFAVYIGFRLALILGVPLQPHSDELWYFNRAIGLAEGKGYSQDGVLTAYWPVGWPSILGIIFRLLGPSLFTAQMVNLVCAGATFLLTLQLSDILTNEKLVGRLSVLLLTIYPNQIAYVPDVGTEVFYTALLQFAMLLVLSGNAPWSALASGIAFGAASLTKAQTLLLPAMLLASWWVVSPRERRGIAQLGRAGLIYITMGAVILPWTARNYRVFGEIVPISTNGGLTLLTGNNPSARGDYTPDDPLVKQVPHDVADQVASDHLATSLALSWMRDHPESVIALVPRKVWRLWAPDGEAEWSYQAGFSGYMKYQTLFRMVRVVNQIYYVILILLFLTSLFHWYSQHAVLPASFITGYVLVLYTTLISIIFSGQSRFHFAMMPWITIYASWMILKWTTVASRPGIRREA